MLVVGGELELQEVDFQRERLVSSPTKSHEKKSQRASTRYFIVMNDF